MILNEMCGGVVEDAKFLFIFVRVSAAGRALPQGTTNQITCISIISLKDLNEYNSSMVQRKMFIQEF